jgi:hypothetical protein
MSDLHINKTFNKLLLHIVHKSENAGSRPFSGPDVFFFAGNSQMPYFFQSGFML